MNITQFIREVRVEMAKVVWPTKEQLVRYTFVVIVFSLVMAAFLGALDFGFQTALNKFIFN